MKGLWVVVLIKDFHSAKQRLRPALEPAQRAELARANATLALAAARSACSRVLAVAGSQEAAALAGKEGAEVLLESVPGGQNGASRAGIARALGEGAGAVLLISSDLPLITGEALSALLEHAAGLGERAVLAAPAIGRGGTNALYLRPPDVIDLHFGDGSLAKFEREAQGRGVAFALHHSDQLALDLDEPEDLRTLASSAPR